MAFFSSAITEIWGDGREESEQIYCGSLKYGYFSSDCHELNCFFFLKVQGARRCKKGMPLIESNYSL